MITLCVVIGLGLVTLIFLGTAIWLMRLDDRHGRYDRDPFRHDDADLEARLAAELHAEADAIDPGPGLGAIRARLGHDTHAWPPAERHQALFPGWRP